MGSTSFFRCRLSLRRGAALWLCLFLLTGALSAQNAGEGIPAGTELQNLERSLGGNALSGAARRDALVRLARLRQLSGDLEGAAVNWLAAAAISAGDAAGEAALIAGAYCLAASGEWEKASAALRPLLAANASRTAPPRARFLDACIKSWRGDEPFALSALAEESAFGPLKSEIYYTLWKSAAGDHWKQRLLAEFPQSIAGRIAAAEGQSAPVLSARPSLHWLLLPGRESITLAPPEAAPQPAKAPAPAGAAVAANAGSSPFLQAGLYSSEANARAQMERLKSSGFAASLVRRTINGTPYWAVAVPPGQNPNATILRLKNSGFESFPVN